MFTLCKQYKTFTVLLACATLACMAQAAAITLQEGSSGYSGCTDSYIGSGGYSPFINQNFGTAPTALFGQESYQSG